METAIQVRRRGCWCRNWFLYSSEEVARKAATIQQRMTGDCCKVVTDGARLFGVVRRDATGKLTGAWGDRRAPNPVYRVVGRKSFQLRGTGEQPASRPATKKS